MVRIFWVMAHNLPLSRSRSRQGYQTQHCNQYTSSHYQTSFALNVSFFIKWAIWLDFNVVTFCENPLVKQFFKQKWTISCVLLLLWIFCLITAPKTNFTFGSHQRIKNSKTCHKRRNFGYKMCILLRIWWNFSRHLCILCYDHIFNIVVSVFMVNFCSFIRFKSVCQMTDLEQSSLVQRGTLFFTTTL